MLEQKTKFQYAVFIIIIFTVCGFASRVILTQWDEFEYDGKIYYEYASTLAFQNHYPNDAIKLHNIGWVLFLVPIFKVIGPHQETLMIAQQIASILFSTLTIPLSYLFAKRFLEPKYAIFVPLLFMLDYRMAQNAGFGITEPLFLSLSLAALATKNRILMFVFCGLACLVRVEGIMLVPVLLILHGKKNALPFVLIPVFILGILFVINSSLHHSDQIASVVKHEIDFAVTPALNTKSDFDFWVNGFSNSLLYMAWAAFPTFIFSIFGLRETKWLIPVLIIMSLSGLWAYLDAYDTRYFFPMFPFLALSSAYFFKRVLKGKID